MKRKAYANMSSWKSDPDRKAMLVQGMRQTGKTYLIKKFAKDNYANVMYFNLEDEPDARSIFEKGKLTSDEIFERLSFLSNTSLVPGKTVIILDEIQASLEAYSALKPLSLDRRFDIIASGSLLGVKISKSERLSPMGYVDMIDMKPMDFEEFLWAVGFNEEQTGYLRDCVQNIKHIDDAICSMVNDLFRRYMVIGGMPEAVKTYCKNMDYKAAECKLEQIIRTIRDDCERYSKGTQKFRISSCLDSIPMQLAKDHGHFEYTAIEKQKGGVRVYGSSLLWLKNAGLIEYCYNLEEPSAPLKIRIRKNSFKIYLSDSGILTSMMEKGTANCIVNTDIYANNGSVLENAIACALISHGYDLLFFGKRNSTLEVDFIANISGNVTAIEVRSGKNKRAKSLRTLIRNKAVSSGIKISDGNVFTDENGIVNYPLFGPSFFRDADDYDIPPVKDLDGLDALFEDVLS